MNSCLLCEKEEEKIEEASFGRLKKQAVLYEEALVSGWLFGWFDMLNPCNSTYNSTFIRAASHPCLGTRSPLKFHIWLIQELRCAHEIEKGRWVR